MIQRKKTSWKQLRKIQRRNARLRFGVFQAQAKPGERKSSVPFILTKVEKHKKREEQHEATY